MKPFYLTLLFISASFICNAQFKVGVGYGQPDITAVINGFASTQVADGVVFSVRRDFQISQSKFYIDPAVDIGIYSSEIRREGLELLIATANISSLIGYRFNLSPKVSFRPWVGPSLVWVNALESEVLGNQFIVNEAVLGLYFGEYIEIKLSDKIDILLSPVNLVLGENGYFEGKSMLFFRF